MKACRAHLTPLDDTRLLSDPVSPSSVAPSSTINSTSRPWRGPPHPCDIASDPSPGPSYFVHTYLPPGSAPKLPPFNRYRPPLPVYPSPPLTDAALASTVPLPDVPGEPPSHLLYTSDRARIVNENMSHDGARHFAPLSPPLTVLVSTKDLPGEHGCAHDPHEVQSWTYGQGSDSASDSAGAPFFPPVRDDSGYEEFHPQGGLPDGANKLDGGFVQLVEPSTSWTLHSPLSIDDGLPPVDLPSIHGALFRDPRDERNVNDANKLDGDYVQLMEPSSSWTPHSPLSIHDGLPALDSIHGILSRNSPGERSSGHADALVSPISPSDADSHSDTWASGSDMDWQYSPSSTFADDLSAPPSPKPGGLSLSLPEHDSPLGFQHHNYSHPPSLSPLEISYNQCDLPWSRGYGESSGHAHVSMHTTPFADEHGPFLSFHSLPLNPPSADIDEYSTVMPSEDDDDPPLLPPSSPRRRLLNDLHDPPPAHDDLCLTPIPRSPHAALLSLPELDMDDIPEPSSPHSPHRALPALSDEDDMFPHLASPPVETIAPALLGGAPPFSSALDDRDADTQGQAHTAGLELCLQPMLQTDLPLARSPSPDDDDLGFLDIQLDPESTDLAIDEFLQLRALRKHALALERAARGAEADLGERITAAACALLPPSAAASPSSPGALSGLGMVPKPDDADVDLLTSLDDGDEMMADHIASESESESESGKVNVNGREPEMDLSEKRARKRELHAMMDMRAEARRTRKLQKQRSKEIGALLDLKMHAPSATADSLSLAPLSGAGWTRSMAHLVANMVLRRRDRSRPLESRPALVAGEDGRERRSASPLSVLSSAEEEEGREPFASFDDDVQIEGDALDDDVGVGVGLVGAHDGEREENEMEM